MTEAVAARPHETIRYFSYTALSSEAESARVRWIRMIEEIRGSSASEPALTVEERFQDFAGRWRAETLFSSSATDLVLNVWYQRIIALGEAVVPLLLRELEREPGHWGYALRVVTGVNPVSPGHSGDLEQIATAWVSWGTSQGIRW